MGIPLRCLLYQTLTLTIVSLLIDTIVSEFMEQKEILLEARKENAELSKGLSNLKTEVIKLKEQLEQPSSGSKVKKKIPLDLSVSQRLL